MNMNPDANTLPSSLQSEALDRPGFQVSGYITKKGTPSGEGAKFNFLPPGQDISNQANADLWDGKSNIKDLVDPNGYDGWFRGGK